MTALTSRARWAGPPRWYAVGRLAGGRPISYVVIHVTDGSEGPSAAEAGAAYDKTRADSVSTHLFVDSDSAVREVRDDDTAYAAYPKGNALGIQVEICGSAAQTIAQWHDAASTATLELAAHEVAVLLAAHGLPPVHLSVEQCRAAWYAPSVATRGIVSHYDVTRAYPEDGGTHTDPGPAFPWTEFLAMVAGHLAATDPAQTEESDMLRYEFDDSWTDRPTSLGGRFVCTDGMGVWMVEAASVPQAGRPAPVVLTKAGTASGKWSFAQAFGFLTGGGVWSETLRGVASWRAAPPAPIPAGTFASAEHTHGTGPAIEPTATVQ